MAAAEIESNFLAFCDSVKKGATVATDKTIKKICTDCGIYCKGMDANRVDIQLRKHLGNAKKELDFNNFLRFIDGPLSEAYAEAKKCDREKAISDLKEKLATCSPKGHGTTKVSKDDATSRLTDVSGYTGAHKERFNEDGTGKGKEGREYIADKKAQEGYVGGYKGMGTYKNP